MCGRGRNDQSAAPDELLLRARVCLRLGRVLEPAGPQALPSRSSLSWSSSPCSPSTMGSQGCRSSKMACASGGSRTSRPAIGHQPRGGGAAGPRRTWQTDDLVTMGGYGYGRRLFRRATSSRGGGSDGRAGAGALAAGGAATRPLEGVDGRWPGTAPSAPLIAGVEARRGRWPLSPRRARRSCPPQAREDSTRPRRRVSQRRVLGMPSAAGLRASGWG